jgi:hypothetical protein
MKLDIFGGPKKGGWSGHGIQEGSDMPFLRSCPFCGSRQVEISNTHTPFYTAHCLDCEAEGPRAYGAGQAWSRRSSKRDTERIHRQAFDDAIDAWNDRS